MDLIKIWLKVCRIIINGTNDTKRSLYLEYKLGFINNDLSPRRCIHCGGMKFNEKVTSMIESCIMEKELVCENCKSVCGYWATGMWMP